MNGSRTRGRLFPLVPLLAVGALLVACGDDGSADEPTVAPTTSVPTTSEAPTTSVPTTTEPPITTAAPTTSTTELPATTVSPGLGQPAVWPAADVVFDTPEAAAADFVEEALRVPAVLGEFQAGDTRSGEIVVYSPGEGGAATQVERSLLLMRQLGPDNGWFVVAAVSGGVVLNEPEPGATVPLGELAVTGLGRGFEALVVVESFPAGDADSSLAFETALAGSAEELLPFAVTLDLRGATPGSVVVLLARGGVGLETDPGEFTAIPVVIAS